MDDDTFTCPDGHPLQGTLETLAGIAEGTAVRNENGRVVLEPSGYTDVLWDEQRTVQEDGEDVWLCSTGDTWKASQLVDSEPEPEVIEVTPTWVNAVDMLITIIREAGSAEAQQYARTELVRMARLADMTVANTAVAKGLTFTVSPEQAEDIVDSLNDRIERLDYRADEDLDPSFAETVADLRSIVRLMTGQEG